MLLQADIIEEFKKAGISRSYRAGETVFLRDEPATGIYLILRGEAKIMRRQPNGENVEVASVKPGETLGEISLLMDKPHTATVIAKTELETLLVTRTRLQDLKRNNPELALRLYEIFAVTLARHLYERPW
jgi:CRP-like cAMP-binding protein